MPRHAPPLAATIPLSLAAIGVAAIAGYPMPREVPDPVLTPGVVASADAAVVCRLSSAGLSYAQEHRRTTPEMKAAVFRRYGMAVPRGAARGAFEVDHLVPLCLGGADVVENLWPQRRDGAWGFPVKDELEAQACHMACAGVVTLEAAQHWFLAPADWREAYRRIFGGT